MRIEGRWVKGFEQRSAAKQMPYFFYERREAIRGEQTNNFTAATKSRTTLLDRSFLISLRLQAKLLTSQRYQKSSFRF